LWVIERLTGWILFASMLLCLSKEV
jgi:hypothetical protein